MRRVLTVPARARTHAVTGARNDRPVQHLIRVQANGAQLRVTSLTPFGERVPLVETAGAAAGRAGAMRQTYYPPLESIAALGARSVASRGWDSTAGKFDFHWDNSDAVIPAPTGACVRVCTRGVAHTCAHAEAAPGPRAGSMNAAVQCELDPDEALSSTRKDVQAAAAAAAANGRSELAVSKVRYFAVPNSSVAAISQGTDTSGLASVSRPQSRARATDERRSNSPAYVRARASQWQP